MGIHPVCLHCCAFCEFLLHNIMTFVLTTTPLSQLTPGEPCLSHPTPSSSLHFQTTTQPTSFQQHYSPSTSFSHQIKAHTTHISPATNLTSCPPSTSLLLPSPSPPASPLYQLSWIRLRLLDPSFCFPFSPCPGCAHEFSECVKVCCPLPVPLFLEHG